MMNRQIIWLDTGENIEGRMETVIKVTEGAELEGACVFLKLQGEEGTVLNYEGKLKVDEKGVARAAAECPGVLLWSPEKPVLYRAFVKITTAEGNVLEREQKLGFRVLRKEHKQVFWNHKPLKLKGICYRERQGEPETTRKDLQLFKEANVNFIRGIYAPFSEEVLALCDEMGFLVENTAPFYELGQSRKNLAEFPHMREKFETEAWNLLDKGSHVSVALWSLGHDCAWGNNFGIIRDLIRKVDEIRLVTFHLPMSIPEEEPQMDVWPVHYIDWRLPFEKTYDQMVIFHTPGAENEIGYMTADAEYDIPVLHEVWSPVVCHNRNEIEKDPTIREFWGNSIRRFVKKSEETPGCLGGAVLAGVDEDGSFEGMKNYNWGILDVNHEPKPEYYHLKAAYGGEAAEASGKESIACPEVHTAENGTWDICWTEDELRIANSCYSYIFSRENCLLIRADAGEKRVLTGGPFLNSTGYLLGEWHGKTLEICSDEDAVNIQVKISGEYENALELNLYLTLFPDGTLETAYEPVKVFRHMPHRVKTEIGISGGGLNEKGGAYLLTDKALVEVLSGAEKVRFEEAPSCEAMVDDRDSRMKFTGDWRRMDDYCGNHKGTETLSNTAGDTMELEFTGTGVTLYGPWDINYGICDIYLDGELIRGGVSQYPEKVDFPGMSRGYEKRYGQVLAEVHGLSESVHKLTVKVTGEKEPGAQNCYTAIDYAVLEGSHYPLGYRLNVNQDYNYARMVRGCVRRPDVRLLKGEREYFRIRLLQEENR